jgi:hypothetical protein
MGIGLILDEFDTRHIRAVTLAVTDLQNARVSTGPLRELRTNFLKQLVGRFTLVDVLASEATRVEGPRASLRDQLLNKGPKLLRLGFSGLNRALLNERGRKIAEQR